MTTSITDSRFTHLHATQGYITALLWDKSTDDDPDPWSVMPGYDENLPVAPHLDPPRLDHDDTLPSQIHPSYPYGRPQRTKRKGPVVQAGNSNKVPRPAPVNLLAHDARADDHWSELNLGALLEVADGREVPPVMAGAKRPPSPRSPQLRPFSAQPPRSQHLRRHLERHHQAPAPAAADQFDAPVPNETYADDDMEHVGQGQRTPE